MGSFKGLNLGALGVQFTYNHICLIRDGKSLIEDYDIDKNYYHRDENEDCDLFAVV